MLLGHPMISEQHLHVRFLGFGAYSLDVELFAFIRKTNWLEYRAIREDINLRIMDIVKEAGTGFAFPSQTVYLGRDAGPDTEQSHRAEEKVEGWRTAGQLPFPDFDKEFSQHKEDSLDYPPQGSPRAAESETETEPQPKPEKKPKSGEAPAPKKASSKRKTTLRPMPQTKS
jgi:MscS family membrane protein